MNETQIGRLMDYLHDIRQGIRDLAKPQPQESINPEKYADAMEIMKLALKAMRERGYGFQRVAKEVESFAKKWGGLS